MPAWFPASNAESAGSRALTNLGGSVRFLSAFALALALSSMPAVAEEISLKDGTKIVGHMTAITPDKIEVETSYGKIQLKRSDILTISFPENGASANAAQ